MPQTILVTGASGFVAAHVLKVFLEAGYHVRGTVRSQSSADKVRKNYPEYEDALSFAIVPDLVMEGAFDEAVKGVDGVIHTASPFILNATDFQKDLFHPALNGTLSVLKATKEFNSSVKRIVITSSFAAVGDFKKGARPGYVYTEADWNPTTTEETEKDNDPIAAYLVSKKIAEQGAFDFVEKEKPNFSVSIINPPMVYGPVLQPVEKLSSLNTSSADIYNLFNGNAKEVPPTGFWAYADVRDLAKAHLLAFESSAAANQRYLVANASYGYQLFVDIIREKFPDLQATTPVGEPGKVYPESGIYKLDTSKAQTELGLKFRPVEETVVDTVKSLQELEARLK